MPLIVKEIDRGFWSTPAVVGFSEVLRLPGNRRTPRRKADSNTNGGGAEAQINQLVEFHSRLRPFCRILNLMIIAQLLNKSQ